MSENYLLQRGPCTALSEGEYTRSFNFFTSDSEDKAFEISFDHASLPDVVEKFTTFLAGAGYSSKQIKNAVSIWIDNNWN